MTQRRTLLLGPPGAGKTERLLRVVEGAMERGCRPDEVAFVTFTRGAAEEARRRACEKFGLRPAQLPNFRTLHSLCFRELGLRRSDVMGGKHLEELAAMLGESVEGSDDPDAPATRMNAHGLVTVDGYARATCRGLRRAWEDHGGNLDWYRLKRFADALAAYKADLRLLDFTDMLAAYAARGAPVHSKVAVIDEAQDLTLLQWRAAMRAFGESEELWAAGDDDQSVHHWAGAATEHFLALGWRTEVMESSHRVPDAVHRLAQQIAARIGRRYPKRSRPTAHQGAVRWVGAPEELDLHAGEWLLLARTRYATGPLAAAARAQGVFYSVKGAPSVDARHARAARAYETMRAGRPVEAADAEVALKAMGKDAALPAEREHYRAADFPAVDWRPLWHDALVKIPLEDREYMLACMRRGERLGQPPRVRIDTMHGAKGAEAKNVLVCTDVTARVWRGYELDPDSEHRVFYTGCTRASENLFLAAPQGQHWYPL